MTFNDYITNNFGTLICCIGLLVILLFNRSFDKITTRVIILVDIFIIIMTVLEHYDIMWTGQPEYNHTRVIMSIFAYNFRIMPLYALVTFMRKNTDRLLLFSVPLLLNIAVTLTALFSDAAFSYDGYGHFQRGQLGYFTHLAAIIYMIMMLRITFMNVQGRNFGEGIIVIFILVSAFTAAVLETFGGRKYLLNLASAAGILMYYMYTHVQASSHDPLTGLLNRASFYYDSGRDRKSINGIISIDMNELKWINDTLGHAEGDKALKKVTRCIYRGMGTQFQIYRTGGDEFTVLCYCSERWEAEKAVKRVRERLDETKYSCAFGIAFRKSDDRSEIDIDEYMKEADALMYEDKKRLKAIAKANGETLHTRT